MERSGTPESPVSGALRKAPEMRPKHHDNNDNKA
jgi:hypothetical protein